MAYAFDFGAPLTDPFGSAALDFSDSTYGLMVTRDRSPLWLPFSVQAVEGSYSPVASAWGPMYKPRYVVYDCKVTAISESARQSQLDAIVRDLMTDSDRVLSPHHRADRFYMARLFAVSEPEWIGTLAARFSLTFLARDGRAYATGTEESETENSAGTGSTWNVNAAEAVPGNIFANPVWIIKTMTNGAGTLTLTNNTRSETLIISGTYTSSHWIRITTAPDQMTIELSSDSGANWSRIDGRGTGVLPCLSPGVQNSMTIDGFTNGGTVVCTYRGRYQ